MDTSFEEKMVSTIRFLSSCLSLAHLDDITLCMLTVSSGQEFQAVVEFAPAQKIPTFKSKPRVDARQGTIDNGKSARRIAVQAFERGRANGKHLSVGCRYRLFIVLGELESAGRQAGYQQL
jgi:hypothetical protein